MIKRIISCLAAFTILCALIPCASFADESADGTIYYLGSSVNTGLNNGFSENNEITEKDPHFGWKLGQFSISGYTSVNVVDGVPVFLKTAGDKIKLSFELAQNISALNGNEALTISEDIDGYDQHYGVSKTNFNHGALIVRQTDYQNKTHDPQLYTDFLSGKEQGADTEVQLFEEGDYDVCLDYEIKADTRKLGPVSIFPDYSNYKIDFKFKVRNGNCMVFPFDIATNSELTNEAYAPNGFYLDIAKSRYLDINVKREVMAAGANGLVEDTRFNGPARDGDRYTEEGVYTITAKNEYTGQQTSKIIYVGDDPILKAYVVNNIPIAEIKARLANGEVIAEDGTLIPAEEAEEIEEQEEAQTALPVALIVAIAAALICAFVVIRRRHPKPEIEEAQKLESGERPAEQLPSDQPGHELPGADTSRDEEEE